MTTFFLSACFAAELLKPVYESRSEIACSAVVERVRIEIPSFREKLNEIRQRTSSVFSSTPGVYQAERIAKRHRMAVRCCDFVERSAAQGDATGCGFAERGLDDIASFVRSFETEFSCWRSHPDNPQVTSVELDIRDFGANGDGQTDFAEPFAAAMAAVRALGGRPCVVRIPAGNYVTRKCLNEAQLYVAGVTNCLVCGEGSDRTRIRFGVFAERGLLVKWGYNLTFRGLELGMERLPYFQGEILANEKERDCIVARQTPGTLAPDDPCWTNRVRQQYCSAEYDPRTGRICNDTTWTSYACESERLEDGVWRLKFDPKLIYSSHRLMKPGNVMVLPFRYNSKGVCYCVGGALVTFDDVAIRSSHSAAFSGAGIELMSLVRCKVLPMPGMYISSDADGCIAPRSTYLAHCDFRNMGDDGVNLVTRGVRVRTSGRAADAFDMWNVAGRKGRYVVIDQATGIHRGNFRDDETLPCDSVGSGQIYLSTIDGTGGVVSDCRFVMNRGASIVIQAPNVLVEDTVADGASGGVRVGTLMRACEGPGPYNCLFRNVRACGGKRGFYAEFETQVRKPALAAGLRGITWDRCVAENSDDPLRLYNVGDGVLKDCVFMHSGERKPLSLSFCEDVSLVGCTMDGALISEADVLLDACRNVSICSSSEVKVLMIGNSFSICNLRQMPQIAEAMGRRLDIASLYIGGCYLERHWNNIVAATNVAFRPYRFDRIVDGQKVVENGTANIPDALVLDKWDVVTIQQSSYYSWKPESYEPFGGLLVAKIRQLAPHARIVVQETWSYPPWFKLLKEFGFDHLEMYSRLHDAYGEFAARHGLDIIPVGTAAEIVPDRNSLFTEPDFHFNRDGEYLQGLTFAAKLFRADIRNCPYNPDWMERSRADEIKAAVMLSLALVDANRGKDEDLKEE